jgi:hypothetical protein
MVIPQAAPPNATPATTAIAMFRLLRAACICSVGTVKLRAAAANG